MPTIRESPVDSPESHALLTEYFGLREIGFAHLDHPYAITYPDPALFVPPAGVFLVVEDDEGTAVGCGGIRRISDSRSGIRYEVKHLYLRPETRGRGWGRLLLEQLEARARTLGAAELVLDTHHTLEAAGRLYAASGFEQVEPYNDNPNATMWFWKPLG